ncbi:MAG: hypothetical protein Q9213_005550 [Squamulea squamosa]
MSTLPSSLGPLPCRKWAVCNIGDKRQSATDARTGELPLSGTLNNARALRSRNAVDRPVYYFTLEALGLFAVSAMKEEAFLDYSDPLRSYNSADEVHSSNRIQIVMAAEASASSHYKATRSTVMWAIYRLVWEIMRTRYLSGTTFTVHYYTRLIYSGSLIFNNNNNDYAVIRPPSGLNNTSSAPPASTSTSLEISLKDSVTADLKSISPLKDDTHYSLDFAFVPGSRSFIRELYVFRAFLALLLQLGKNGAASHLSHIAMAQREQQAWVFMSEFQPAAAEGYDLRQYHAIAIVEAVAKFFEIQGQYREMTFLFQADGHLVARGCVTKAVQSRSWCGGLFPNSGLRPNGGVGGGAVMS